MVAVPTQAIITALHAQEDGSRDRVWRQLARGADAGGTITIAQGDLAKLVGLHVRTVGRAIAGLRTDGFITTQGATEVLTYGLLVWPDAPEAPRPLRPVAEASDIAPPEASDILHADPARGSLSSSSSSGFGPATAEPSDIPPAPTFGHSGGEPPEDPPRLTARGEIWLRYHVQPNAEIASGWAALDDEGKAIFAARAKDWPPTKGPERATPTWFAKVLDSTTEELQARRLARRIGIDWTTGVAAVAEPPQEPPRTQRRPRPARRPAPMWRVAAGIVSFIARVAWRSLTGE